MIDGYDWPGGREAMLRFGPADGPLVVAAMPLLEEWNRTRAFVVALLRALAARGLAGALPDLPGQGESVVPTDHARLAHWRSAFAAACVAAGSGRPLVATVSLRGGALIEQSAPVRARWRLSPSTGPEVVREFDRFRRTAALRDTGRSSVRRDGTSDIAGNRVSVALLEEMANETATGPDGIVRVVRLDTDPRPADLRLSGRPLWRGSEPGSDAALVAALADDIAVWTKSCAG